MESLNKVIKKILWRGRLLLRSKLPSSVYAHNTWIKVDSASKNNMGVFVSGKDDLGDALTTHEDWIEDEKYNK